MKIRHEIFLGSPIGTNPDAKFYYDPSKFSGSVTEYLEDVPTAATGSDEIFGSDDVSHGSLTFSAAERLRVAVSSALTADEYKVNIPTDGVACRLIVIQDTGSDPITAMQHQFEIGDYEIGLYSTGAALTYPKYWYYDSSNWDGSLSCYAEVVWAARSDKYAVTIKLQEDNGSWSFSDKVTIVNAGTSTTMTRTRVAFTPTTGRHYRLYYSTAGTKENYGLNIYCGRIVIDQTDATAITKWEAQHLLQNTGEASTGLTGMNTLWDTTNEWDGVTISAVYHQIECSASSSDADLYEDADDTASKIASSDATGTANLVRSSDISANMPSSADELDTYVNTA